MQSVNTSPIEFEGELLRGGYTGVKTALFDGRRRFGEGENEVTAGVELTFGANGTAVGLDHVTCDGQTEASAAGLPGAGFVDAVEALEDATEVFGGDAGAKVADTALDRAAGAKAA